MNTKEYKKSKFVVSTSFYEKTVFHNVLTNKGFMALPDRAERIKEILKDPNIEHNNNSLFQKLFDTGFILQNSVDELELVKLKREQELENGKKVLSLTIIPTYECDFECIYCWEKTEDEDNSMTLYNQEKLIKYLEVNIKKYSSLNIDWFGGEPLLAFQVIKNLSGAIDKICREAKVPYFCSITTNGYSLTIEKFEFLLEHHTRFFQITIDGPAELHNSNRPLKSHKRKQYAALIASDRARKNENTQDNDVEVTGGTFEKIMQNLRNIRDNVKQRSFTFVLRLNLTKETKQYSEEFITFIRNEFGADERFKLYMQSVEEHNRIKEAEMGDRYIERRDDFTESVYNFALDQGINVSTLRMDKPGDLMCKTKQENSYFVNSDGNFYKCDMEMKTDHVTHVGEIDETGVLSVNKKNLDFWNDISQPEYCKTCVLLPMCNGFACPYYNTLNPRKICELYNNSGLIKGAIKTFAQKGKYEIV